MVVGNPSLRASDGGSSVHQTRDLGAGLPGDIEGYAGGQLPELHQLLGRGDHPPVLSPVRLPETLPGPPEALHVVLTAGLGPTVRPEPQSAQGAHHRQQLRPQQL